MNSYTIQLACLSVGILAVLLLTWDKSATGGVGLVALQAIAAGVMALVHASDARDWTLFAVVCVGIAARAVVAPILLRRTAARLSLPSESDPKLHTAAALLVALLILLATVFIFAAVLPGGITTGLAFGQALVGIWVIASRRGTLAQVTGVMATEIGIGSLLTLSGGLSPALELLLIVQAMSAFLVLLVIATMVRRAAGNGDVRPLGALSEYDEEAA